MRAVMQRVSSARVEVEGGRVSQIGPGLLVLVGVLDTDTDKDAEYMCRKILNTRIFNNDETGKPWDFNVMQKGYQVLLVSQFTLYGILKGNKLDFHVAMTPERAKPFYESFVQRVSKAYSSDAVKDGLFGAMMQVHLVNDGPVTIQLDSRKETSAELNQSEKGFVGLGARCQVVERNFLSCERAERGLQGLTLNVDASKTKGDCLSACTVGARRTVSFPGLAVCTFRTRSQFSRQRTLPHLVSKSAPGLLLCTFP